ncbi:hypothetical protein Q1695_013508 [Nippostrongylus brasiliensis]|nr:hypothetical protein Q1695_013508 [Nippostrongylus brasiliensis]
MSDGTLRLRLSSKGTHRRTLLVATGDGKCKTIERLWGNDVKCVEVAIRTKEFITDMDWGSKPYFDFMNLRTFLWLTLAKADINFVSIEADATWFRDPYQLFEAAFSSPKFTLSDEYRAKRVIPYVLNNNYIIGNDRKENRQVRFAIFNKTKIIKLVQKSYGFWFVLDNGVCNDTAISNILNG